MYVSLIFSLLLYTSCSFYARYLYSSLLSVYLSIAVDTTFLLFLLVTLSPSVERNGTGANKASTSAKKMQGRINHASHFVTPGSTALKLYSRFEENSP